MNVFNKDIKMKKACTVFLLVFFATSCAKKITQASSDGPSRDFASTEQTLTIKSSSNEQSYLTFSKGHDFAIPGFVESTKGSATGQKARIYFDYSSQASDYAYYCNYMPSSDDKYFEFENCYFNEASEQNGDSMTYSPGYIDFIYENNSIILEVLNTQNLDSIDVQVDIEATEI